MKYCKKILSSQLKIIQQRAMAEIIILVMQKPLMCFDERQSKQPRQVKMIAIGIIMQRVKKSLKEIARLIPISLIITPNMFSLPREFSIRSFSCWCCCR